MTRVLVISDTHAPAMRRGYVDFLQRTRDAHDCTKVVHIGDLVDWNSISFHEKNPSLANAEAEFAEAYRQVQSLAKAFPRADWMIGNHDSLTERQANVVGLPTRVLKDYAELWEIKWRTHPRFAKLVIDDVVYSHGDSGRQGQHAALAQSKDNFRSTVIGHLHSQAGISWWANSDFRIFGLSVGCGIDASKMQFDYGRKFVAKPVLGCGVVLDGKRAFFEPWLLPSAKVEGKKRRKVA
jgi:predicted phosphodiesterase